MSKTYALMIALAVTAFGSMAVAQPIYQGQQQVIYPQYAPQEIYQGQGQIIGQPFQGQIIGGPIQGMPGTVVVDGATPWDASQGYDNNDPVLRAVENTGDDNMARFRYPASAEGNLKYMVNDSEGELVPGTNLAVPVGEEFKVSFFPTEDGAPMAADTMKKCDVMFTQTDAGWKLEDFVLPNQPIESMDMNNGQTAPTPVPVEDDAAMMEQKKMEEAKMMEEKKMEEAKMMEEKNDG